MTKPRDNPRTSRYPLFTLSLEAHKESRQKRLVEHREYNLKTAILQYFIDTGATNITRLHSHVVIGLDSLDFKKHVRMFARSTNPVRLERRRFSLPCLRTNILVDTYSESTRRAFEHHRRIYVCLLYTSPSPRDS